MIYVYDLYDFLHVLVLQKNVVVVCLKTMICLNFFGDHLGMFGGCFGGVGGFWWFWGFWLFWGFEGCSVTSSD